MNFHRQKSYRETARLTSTGDSGNNYNNKSKRTQNKKRIIRCKYCYRSGHVDFVCPDKKHKRPPYLCQHGLVMLYV